jgi:SAM-dependent methyltransferase
VAAGAIGAQNLLAHSEDAMLEEISHFVRHAPEVLALQKNYSRAEFMDLLNRRSDEHGYAEVRREVLEGLSGRVLEIGCGTGSMFAYYPGDVEVDPRCSRSTEARRGCHQPASLNSPPR